MKKRRNVALPLMIFLGGLLIILLILYIGTSLYIKLEERNNRSGDVFSGSVVEGQTGENQNTTGVMPEVVYTQREVDALLEEAVRGQKEALVTADREGAQRILDQLQKDLESGSTMVEALRPLYPENIVVVSNGAFHFVPIREDLVHNDYVQENVEVSESGEIRYLQDGQPISHKGIDVSKHQGKIDWEKVAADGVEFAFIRVGLRGYSTGEIVEDEMFEKNIKGAMEAGVKVGVYFFSQAITAQEAEEEAAFVLDKIADYELDCPVVYDVEKVGSSTARMNKLTPEERTEVALAFCRAIEEAGERVMLYHNMEMAAVLSDIGEFEQYDKWFASYSEVLYYPYAYKIWQYSDKGTVDGISGKVDLNIAFEPVWE